MASLTLKFFPKNMSISFDNVEAITASADRIKSLAESQKPKGVVLDSSEGRTIIFESEFQLKKFARDILEM